MSITAFNNHESTAREIPSDMEEVKSAFGRTYIYAEERRSAGIDPEAAVLLQSLMRAFQMRGDPNADPDKAHQYTKEVPERLHEKSDTQIAVWLGVTAARFGANVALMDMQDAETNARQLLAETIAEPGNRIEDMGLLIVVDDNRPANISDTGSRASLRNMVAWLDIPVLSVGEGYVRLVDDSDLYPDPSAQPECVPHAFVPRPVAVA